MNYFYFDQTNQKRGPVSEQQLRDLATQGLIGPHTPMETDTGHKGVAGQIPGLFPAQGATPPPKQLFCTNCAQPVPENASGCMSCGLKATGHKKFCRQCGAGRTPEQIVCTQCGANLATTFIPDAKKVMESVVSSSSSGIIRKFAFRGIIIAVIAGLIWFILSFFPPPGGGSMYLNQLKSAKSGEWAEYEYTLSMPGERDSGKWKVRQEVLSKSDRSIKIETTITHPHGYVEKQEMEIDLSASSDEQLIRSIVKEIIRQQNAHNNARDFVDKIKFDIRSGRRSSETLSTGGQSFRCTVVPFTVSTTVGSLTVTVRDIKTWLSSSAPFGLVQAEFRMDVPPDFDTGRESAFVVTVRLTGFRKT